MSCLVNQAAHFILQIYNNRIYPDDVAGADLIIKLRIKFLYELEILV